MHLAFKNFDDISKVNEILFWSNTATNPKFHSDYYESLLRMKQKRDRVDR